MSVSSIIDSAAQGLRATQAGLDVVSQNVANAGSVGYTRRVVNTTETVSGNRGTGVNVTGVQRTLDTLLQKQLRLESAGAAYTGTVATAHTALDAAFDRTHGAASLSSLVNGFSSALQSLAGSPSVYQARAGVITAASDLAGSLNGLTKQVQTLRQGTEDSLGQDVSSANDLLKQIASLNTAMVSSPANAASPALQDQRDRLIDQLSSMMDLTVTPSSTRAVKITTSGGLQLVDGSSAVTLSFDGHSPLAPESAYSTDPTKRSVGTITATDALGNKTDVVALGMIRSGSMAATIELRDKVLPEAQAQLDAMAAGLSSAMSDKTVAGTAATTPPPPAGDSGFDLDLTSLLSGKGTFTLSYTDATGPQSLTFKKVTSPALAGPLPDGSIGIDFSGGVAGVLSQVTSQLGGSFAVSAASPTLRILNSGSGISVTGLSASVTVTDLSGPNPELPLFVEGGTNAVYSGYVQGNPQLTGFAGRISVNPAVLTDPKTLVVYTGHTDLGDTSRPALIQANLNTGLQRFSSASGIGSGSGFTGTVADFAQRVIAKQASDSIAASNLDDGQKTVLNGVRGRYSEQAGVNIDTELTQLIQLQTAYSANARVMTAGKDLMDMLLRTVQ